MWHCSFGLGEDAWVQTAFVGVSITGEQMEGRAASSGDGDPAVDMQGCWKALGLLLMVCSETSERYLCRDTSHSCFTAEH